MPQQGVHTTLFSMVRVLRCATRSSMREDGHAFFAILTYQHPWWDSVRGGDGSSVQFSSRSCMRVITVCLFCGRIVGIS